MASIRFQFPARRYQQLSWDRLPAGYTLLELLAVVSLLGVLALMSTASFRRDAAGNLQARTDAYRLAADLRLARSETIASGNNHLLVFDSSEGRITGYALHQRQPSGTVAVGEYHSFADNVIVTVPPSGPEFEFEGTALGSSTITVSGPQRTWQVSVIASTGFVEVIES